MRKLFIPLGLLIILTFVISTYINNSRSKELVFGTAPTLAPFTYVGGKHGSDVIGFDIELANAIAKERGQKLNTKIMYFQDLLPGLQKNEIDMAISVITITDERKQLVDFSDGYFDGSVVALVKKDKLASFEGIDTKEALGANKRLATQANTLAVELSLEIAGDNPVLQPKTWDIAVSQLLKDDVDAVIINRVGAIDYIKRNNNLTILPNIVIIKTQYAVAVKKGNRRLLDDINKTLQKLRDSGEYDNLVLKYIE